MRERVRELLAQGDRLFDARRGCGLDSLWQSLAENFHVMRADFTRTRFGGEEFASFLMTGRPAMAHRDLSNSLSFMLRPRDQQWFHARTSSERINKNSSAKAWLDWASEQQRRAMYDMRAKFLRATKEGDKDFTGFGNAVLTIEPRRNLDGLLYRCWHLRDVVWEEDAEGELCAVHFDWKPKAYQLCELFPNTVSVKLKEAKDKDRLREVKCRRIVMKAYDYDLPARRDLPWMSIYLDVENNTILEEKPLRVNPAVLPRWETVSGSQYAYSPAAIYALPDARMLQQITLTILEAGQKVVDPPTIAVGDVIQGGINLFAGGTTHVDPDYDERTGEVLRPITLKPEGLAFGAAREERIEKAIDDAWFLSKIRYPEITKQMTAYEAQRIQEEFIRSTLPLFEPMETEYNGQVCATSFYTLRNMGAFGSILDMPEQLRAEDVRFEFDSPIQEAAGRAKVQKYQQMVGIVIQGAQIDPDVALNADWDESTRDAIDGSGAPSTWLLPEERVAQLKQRKAELAAAKQAAEAVATGADVATRVAGAGESAARASQVMAQTGMA